MKLNTQRIKKFQKTIGDYYRRRGRRLPWRSTGDPYKILVSETMLQQTQVSRVIPFYEKFVHAFPTVRALAGAPVRSVLRLWQGLGYNRRALNLQRAALIIVREHGGVVPRDIEKLDALPGIGRATAAAVLAYAWNEPDAFVETNIRAVFIHHFFPHRNKIHDEEILKLVRRTLPQHTNILHLPDWSARGGQAGNVGMSAREWYSALMDYGAHLKEAASNDARRSAHYARQTRFKGSSRELRGAIVRRAVQKGRARAADFTAFAKKGLPVGKILHALVAEGFLRKQGGEFVVC